MPRNLVLCFDGTSNEFGASSDTNVVRLAQVIDRDQLRQLLFYDPGVGTLPEQGVATRIGRFLSKLAGLAFGTGILTNVTEGYRFLAQQWHPGDKVYIFGFSRGAYTARALASMLHMFGLLPPDNDNFIPYLIRIFAASRSRLHGSRLKEERFWKLTNSIRETFARDIDSQPERRFPIYFVGVWETVSSVGWVWNPQSFPFTARNPSIHIVRHAIAIDERRSFFRQNQFGVVPGQDVKEVWFAGVHADVGGGYPVKEGGLWRVAYTWMLEEAKAAGLLTEVARERAVLETPPVPRDPALEPQHYSLKSWWHLAEYVPKKRYSKTNGETAWRLGRHRWRKLPADRVLHPSVDRRRKDLPGGYNPPNLRSATDRDVEG